MKQTQFGKFANKMKIAKHAMDLNVIQNVHSPNVITVAQKMI